MECEKLIALIEQEFENGKKAATVVIDVKKKSGFFEYLIIASAPSPKEAREMLIKLLDSVPKEPQVVIGAEKAEWIVVSYEKILVHIFLPEVREKYNLEKLWKDGDNIREVKTISKRKVKK